jgi:hypothetical protein
MIRSLAMIAVAGFVVCVLSFAGAAALGGAALTKNGWDWAPWADRNRSDVDFDMRDIDWDSAETTKEMVWSGSEELEVALPAEVTVTQGDTPKMVITGPKDAVEHVEVDGGHIGFSKSANVRVTIKGMNLNIKGLEGFRRLKIQITAPNVRRVDASVASKVNLVGFKRDELELKANAGSNLSGDIDVRRLELEVHSGANAELSGKADEMDLDVHSAGDAKLDKLVVKSIHGEAKSGADASIAAIDSIDMEVHSGADVTIYGRPTHVNTNTHSGGDVHYASPADAAPAATNAPATNAPSAPTAPSPPPAPRTKRT